MTATDPEREARTQRLLEDMRRSEAVDGRLALCILALSLVAMVAGWLLVGDVPRAR